MRLLTIVLLGLLAMTAADQARAGVQLGAGVVDEIDGEATHLFTLSWLTDHKHPWEFAYGHIVGRDNPGEFRTPDVSYLAASKRITFGRWFLSGGIAWTDEDNEVLSGHAQFLTGAGYRFDRWSLSLRHLSNANTKGRNRGETFLLLEVGF